MEDGVILSALRAQSSVAEVCRAAGVSNQNPAAEIRQWFGQTVRAYRPILNAQLGLGLRRPNGG